MKNNTKKKKKITKKKYGRIFAIIIVGLMLLVGLYFFLNAEDEESNLTLLEKQWVENNKSTLIDINVPNNLSVLGENGTGVLFDYLSTVEATGLNFNKTSYNYPNVEINKSSNLSILVLKNTDKLEKNDMLILEDSYVLIGKSEGFITEFSKLSSPIIGIISDDKNLSITDYNNSIKLKVFDNNESLISALVNNNVDYVVAPRYSVLNEIVKNTLYIKYDFNNLSNKVVLRLGNSEKLNNIMVKFLADWKENKYENSFEENLMRFYVGNKLITDVDKSYLSSRVFTYGFVKNSSYNVVKGNKLYGLAGEYINTISNMAGIEFDFIEYDTNTKLIDAIKQGIVDLAFINFDYNNESGFKTVSAFDSKLVALGKNNEIITDKQGLVNRNLYLYENENLAKYLQDNYNCLITTTKKIDQKISNNDILVLDEYDYMNYKDEYLASYNYLFMDNYKNSSYYYVQSGDEILYHLINFVLNNTDYYEMKNKSINNYNSTLSKENNFKSIYVAIICIILVPIFILVLAVSITKTSAKLKLNKKENILKYNDMLTSLKNRNYLNANMNKWDDAKANPRTIIIVDLNNLKYINDNYGYSEGDTLIKKAAAILINTQLEKSEIIRTDGNEFLIYLIGYNKTQVSAYINKLEKEFEKLPYGFGAAVGYSMIEDEINTIEDAINDATIEMHMNKEQNYK